MRRRDFITLVGGAAVAWPVAAEAQQPERMRRIGVLNGNAEGDPERQAVLSAFLQALAALGWRDGRNIRIEYRWASGDASRLRALAAELASLTLDVIFTSGTPPTTALRQAAPTTPIVFVNVTDPVASGLVSSFAHPGGNITGFTSFELTMGSKWLETLKEVAPSVNRVAVPLNPENAGLLGQLRSIEAAAPTLGVQVSAAPVRGAAEIERAIDAFASGANGGLVVLNDFITDANRELIITLAARHRLPAVYAYRYFVTEGGLISYGPDQIDSFRRAAGYVDRIIRGEKPADLPVQGPTKYELAINMKTAKALGITVPLRLQAIADEVIE
jgi:putative tryptophan/tyrosine transport system substrate-binding protein